MTKRVKLGKGAKITGLIMAVLAGLWLLGATEGDKLDHPQLPWQDNSPGSNQALSANMDSYVKGWTDDYSSKMESNGNAATSQTDAVTGHLSGPVVIVNPRKKQIVAQLQAKLPDNLKPKNAQDVRIVVWVDHYTRATSKYSDGSSALTWYADQTFVDVSSQQILGYTELAGGDPPDRVYTNGSRTGNDIPNNDIAKSIVTWVQNTPNSK